MRLVKLLVWCAGSYGLFVLASRFATWRLLLQLVVLAALFLWVVGGGALLAYRGKQIARTARVAAADRAAATVAHVRASYVHAFGEESARAVETRTPDVWAQIARGVEAAK